MPLQEKGLKTEICPAYAVKKCFLHFINNTTNLCSSHWEVTWIKDLGPMLIYIIKNIHDYMSFGIDTKNVNKHDIKWIMISGFVLFLTYIESCNVCKLMSWNFVSGLKCLDLFIFGLGSCIVSKVSLRSFWLFHVKIRCFFMIVYYCSYYFNIHLIMAKIVV